MVDKVKALVVMRNRSIEDESLDYTINVKKKMRKGDVVRRLENKDGRTLGWKIYKSMEKS
jgi:hypothetical protein